MTIFQEKPQDRQIIIEDDRTGLDVNTIKRAIADNLYYLQGKLPQTATINDYYLAVAYSVRDRLMPGWLATTETYFTPDVKIVCYFSAEFLLGPHLSNNLINLNIYDRYQSYIETQETVSQAYRNPENWTKMSILNVARMSKFSSDRSIGEYCQDIWHTSAVPIEITAYSQANAALNLA